MALKGKDNIEKVYNYFVGKLPEAGIFGLMGNLAKESGMNPENLQNTFEKRLNYSDRQYTQAVDDGTYTNFVRDSAGYGLAQWTWWGRKQNMYDFIVVQRKKSIGDLESQLEFLYWELTTGYKGVWNALKSAKTIREASDVVLHQFERPADQSESVEKARAKSGEDLRSYIQSISNNNQKKEENSMKYSRQSVVDLIESWVGKNEANGSHKAIIDIYNSQSKLPRSYKVKYTDAWCATTWSALAVKLGYQAIMPIECSCSQLIKLAQQMGIWQESDFYVPMPGDALLYDWDDNGVGDDKGSPEHIGTVTYVNKAAGYMIVTEGNYSNAVKKRTISLNGKFIRGFITPKYTDDKVEQTKPQVQNSKPNVSIDTIAREVIAGKWGTSSSKPTRTQRLEAAGYNYAQVQKRVNEILNGKAVQPTKSEQPQNQEVTKKVTATCSAKFKDSKIAGKFITTANLNLRNDAGTNKKALVVIPKNTEVTCYGLYNKANGVMWYYVQVAIDKVQYTGFCSSAYLKRA